MATKDSDDLANQMWGLVVTQGVVAILFGIAALFWPGATLAIIVILFGVFVLVWGIVEFIHSLLSMGRVSTWWLELIFSLLIIGLGVFLLRNTLISIGLFILLVGFTFIIRGGVDLLKAFLSKEQDVKDTRLLHVIGGLLGIIAGIIVLSQPAASGVAIVWIIGLYSVLQGAMVIAIAMKLRPAVGK